MTDKIIESIFFQFTVNLIQITQTQKIITCMVLKFYKWIWGNVMCMNREKFLKE